MKKIISYSGLGVILILFLFTYFPSNAQTITIKCPEGDKYTCYTKGDLTVKKGEGESIVVIKIE